MESDIPGIIVGRLPVYLQALEHLQARGVLSTSSQELGAIIGISAAQIRKDLSQFGEFGKQGKGYAIPYLVEQLRAILKVDRVWEIVVIGAGNLGRAIAHYENFHQHGFHIAQIFDNDPERIGMKIQNLVVRDTKDLVSFLKESDIKMAMLTVPPAEAQAVTDELVKGGVRAILNYAPITISVPSDVCVQHVDPVIYLQRMTYYLE